MLVKPIRLTKEQLLKVGKKDTPSKVKFLDEDGGGYMAALEVNHQVHCLVPYLPLLLFSLQA